LLAAPRVLVPLASLAAACSVASGCVPAMRYEEANSAADVETEARRRAELALSAAQARVAELEAELKRRDQRAEAGDQKLAEERFARGVAAKELSETSSLISQLREDLARANQNLVAVTNENTRLSQKNAQIGEPAADSSSIAALARELDAVLGALKQDPRVRVVVRENSLSIRIEASALFESDRASTKPEVALALGAASTFLASHPGVRCTLREGKGEAALPSSLGRERRERLVSLLAERKLSERVTVQLSDATSASTPESYELVLTAAQSQ
jgi:flagellar motor protein MotB